MVKAANQFGVARAPLSRVLNGHAAVSPTMGLRFTAWLDEDRGGDAKVQSAEEVAYDRWQTDQWIKIAKRPAGPPTCSPSVAP